MKNVVDGLLELKETPNTEAQILQSRETFQMWSAPPNVDGAIEKWCTLKLRHQLRMALINSVDIRIMTLLFRG